ncbi:MAG: exodeoxyribonuclease III [Deltaproteobacteria bacterium]|nr:exodeoxyribonuclease III [Deltaproteobacteria bacterium]
MVSWNVNGIRAILKKGFYDFVANVQPDIICLQETRTNGEEFSLELPGFEQYWYSADKKGYSGTAVLSREKPQKVLYGIGLKEHDREGRLLTLEFPNFFLVNVYTPNAQAGLKRLSYRTDKWDIAFLGFLKELEKKKPVIFCGDLNVAHKEIDLARPKDNKRSPGFTDEERTRFDQIIKSGFVDTYRVFHKDGGHYTWWSYRTNARARNVGWRIDYVCMSESLASHLVAAEIHDDVLGSDHCPVSATFSF